ncbi:MAG: hypothetical protein JJU06_17585 [Ectothiorhodospiraceae bacterium]|nr:hypothetical protein [Ectothiorhodospiraceae bacterium]MCH8502718.1 hypothetical protein [Ectothiorhodospiraceae bacterium]
MDKTRTWVFLLFMLLAFSGFGLVACDDQGPAEEAGEEIDDTAEDIGDAFDD